jgi:hypothetical protein
MSLEFGPHPEILYGDSELWSRPQSAPSEVHTYWYWPAGPDCESAIRQITDRSYEIGGFLR